MLPAGYRTSRNNRLWTAHHEHFGDIADDRECEAAAEALAHEHADAMAEHEAGYAAAIAAHDDEPLLQKAA